MSETKPKKEMTQTERFHAWKNWWKTCDTFYKRAAQFAATMEHNPSEWELRNKYYVKMLKYATTYEKENPKEQTWEGFCKWNQERKQKKREEKHKSGNITEETNN